MPRPDETARIEATTSAAHITDIARELTEEAAAVRAESRQARRHAQAVREESTAILDSVVLIAGEVLKAGGFAVAEPVAARFRSAESGTTGVEVMVRLEDPERADRAAAALARRFGGAGPPDAIIVR